MSKKPNLIRPSPEEAKRIQSGIDADPDTFEWTGKDFAAARPATETHPELVEEYKRGRGKQKAATKVQKTIRLSPDVIEYFEQDGPGWQTRLDDFLRAAIAKKNRKAG